MTVIPNLHVFWNTESKSGVRKPRLATHISKTISDIKTFIINQICREFYVFTLIRRYNKLETGETHRKQNIRIKTISETFDLECPEMRTRHSIKLFSYSLRTRVYAKLQLLYFHEEIECLPIWPDYEEKIKKLVSKSGRKCFSSPVLAAFIILIILALDMICLSVRSCINLCHRHSAPCSSFLHLRVVLGSESQWNHLFSPGHIRIKFSVLRRQSHCIEISTGDNKFPAAQLNSQIT